MPKLVRFVLVNSAIGVAIGWAIAAGLIWFNISGLGDLVMHSSSRVAALVVLGSSFGITFGFAYLTTSVLLLPTDKDEFDRY
ncbi:MAG: hypothetical protein WAT70_06340 [Rhizobiaceae bacterium]